jgi:hypothetical protein
VGEDGETPHSHSHEGSFMTMNDSQCCLAKKKRKKRDASKLKKRDASKLKKEKKKRCVENIYIYIKKRGVYSYTPCCYQ